MPLLSVASAPQCRSGRRRKIDTLLRYDGKRTVVFSFKDTAGSAKAKLRIAGTPR